MQYECMEFKPFYKNNHDAEAPRRLQEFEEQRHTLLSVRCEDGQCVAKFPNGEFVFPEEIREKLEPLVGRETAILRLEGYHIRAVDGHA